MPHVLQNVRQQCVVKAKKALRCVMTLQEKDNVVTFFEVLLPCLRRNYLRKAVSFSQPTLLTLLVGKGPTFRLYAGALMERCLMRYWQPIRG